MTKGRRRLTVREMAVLRILTRRVPRASLYAVALTLGLLAFSPSAVAGTFVQKDGGYTYVTEGYEAGPGSTITVKSDCPGRTRVLSGGASSFGGFGDSYISSSYPYDDGDRDKSPDDGWKTKISAFDSFVDINAYAACAKLKPTYRDRRYEIAPMTSSTDEAVPCPDGDVIVHGGFKGPTSVRPGSTFPFDGGTDDAWGLRPENVSGEDQKITGFAVCSDELEVTYIQSGTAPMPTGAQVFAEPQCPPSDPNIVGGGPISSATFGSFRLVSNLPDFFPQPSFDEWSVQAENAGPPASYLAWATCAPNL